MLSPSHRSTISYRERGLKTSKLSPYRGALARFSLGPRVKHLVRGQRPPDADSGTLLILSRETAPLQLPLEPQPVEVMFDLVLVFQEPINRRLVAHGLLDDLRSRLAVDIEEGLVVEFVDFGD
jgi:hypothetical protein